MFICCLLAYIVFSKKSVILISVCMPRLFPLDNFGLFIFEVKQFDHGVTLSCVWGSLITQLVKNLPIMWETCVQSQGREDPLEEEMAAHSSILAWRIPQTEVSGGLQCLGSQRVWHNWVTNTHILLNLWVCGFYQIWNIFSHSSSNRFSILLYPFGDSNFTVYTVWNYPPACTFSVNF